MERRRIAPYLAVLVVLLAGAVLCLVASGMSWGAAQRADLARTEVQVTGGDLLALGRAVGLLGLAAVIAVHATRRWGRRLVGGLLAAAGGVLAGQAYVIMRDLPDQVLEHLKGTAGAADFAAVTTASGGPLVMAVGGAGVAVAGSALAVFGPRWPSMGTRYERQAGSRPTGRSGERAVWDALDRGEDPTI
jgi:uncharacterized membrane protein (TIGR02234 family)